MFISNLKVYASATLSVSSQSVSVGDKFTVYVKMNSDSLKFCLKVKERMRDLRDFESRMVTMVALVNSQVKEYIEIEGLKEVDDFQVSREGALAMGLPETVIPDVVVYKFVQRKHFVLNFIQHDSTKF